jgi:hypothetical protein
MSAKKLKKSVKQTKPDKQKILEGLKQAQIEVQLQSQGSISLRKQ